MDEQIVKLRELLSEDANKCAQSYLECVCHADETERILNRTSSRDKKRKKKFSRDFSINIREPSFNTVEAPTTSAVELNARPLQDRVPQEKRWWDQLQIHRPNQYYEERKHETRQMWTSQREFIFSSFGFVLGVGNFIRFPGLVYAFGGVFILPYLCCYTFIGFPLLFLHMFLGQFSGLKTNSAIKRIAPIASGLGFALIITSIPLLIYHISFSSYALFYIFHCIRSLFSPVQWESCVKDGNYTEMCCPLNDSEGCQNSTLLSVEAFFYSSVLNLPNDAQPAYAFLPPLLICLLVSCLLTYCTIRTTQRCSCLPIVFSTVPFLIMWSLFISGISLNGANKGIAFLMRFDIEKLWTFKIWQLAAGQVIFELGLTSTPLLFLASRNGFRNNIFRDVIYTSFVSTGMSILSALVSFVFIGNLTTILNTSVDKVIGVDAYFLTFVVMPSVSYSLKGGLFWCFLFFVMVFVTSANTILVWIEMIAAFVLDFLSSKNRKLENKLIAFLCGTIFVLGLPFSVRGGYLLFYSIDQLITTCPTALTIPLLLLIVITQIYGSNAILDDLGFMLRIVRPTKEQWKVLSFHHKLQFIFGPNGIFIKYCWMCITPVCLLLLIMGGIYKYARIMFAGESVPLWLELVAWTVTLPPLLVIILYLIKDVRQARLTGKTLGSLFDSSAWSQMDNTCYGTEEIGPTSEPQRRRTAIRENTYMYIDPVTRANTVRSQIFSVENNYGWRVGRLKEVQDEQSIFPSSPSQPSFEASMTSQGTVTAEAFTLFGSPPASNAYMLSDTMSTRKRSENEKSERSPSNDQRKSMEDVRMVVPMSTFHCTSEPPIKRKSSVRNRLEQSECSSPTRSEPPLGTDRPSSSIRSKSESHDELSDSEDENGIRRERVTVIRRFTSEDSFGPQSVESISITPIDLPRQRSLSSVAIYAQEKGNRPTQTLSQLKRPAPIHAPSPTRF